MSGIRGKDTKIEKLIRSGLHLRGIRFRLHKKGLPGKPDLFLKKHNAAIFINGCFWHAHTCYKFRPPKTRTAFWKEKLDKNKQRDRKNLERLLDSGFRVLTIWECSLDGKISRDPEEVIDDVICWLLSNDTVHEITGRDKVDDHP